MNDTKKPPVPAAQGPNIAAARAILAGKPLPANHEWNSDHATKFDIRSKEVSARPPVITIEMVITAIETSDRHEAIEEAIEEIFYSFDCGVNETENVLNPIFIHEIRQAQRRTLERLLELADQEVQHAGN